MNLTFLSQARPTSHPRSVAQGLLRLLLSLTLVFTIMNIGLQADEPDETIDALNTKLYKIAWAQPYIPELASLEASLQANADDLPMALAKMGVEVTLNQQREIITISPGQSRYQFTDADIEVLANRLAHQSSAALTRLNFYISKFTEKGFQNLGGLTGVHHLEILQEDLSDAKLAHLGRLTKLKSFCMQKIASDDSKATSPVPMDQGLAFFKHANQIESLTLKYVPIGDAGLVHCRHLSRLNKIDLYAIPLTGTFLSQVANRDSLDQLRFSNCPISDVGLKAIGQLPRVETLQISNGKITDEGLKHLQGAAALSNLSLTDCSITNAGVKHLMGLPELVHLDLSETKANDGCADDLLKMPKLKSVMFGYDQISAETYERLKATELAVNFFQLRDVRRTSNLLRFEKMDYEVDLEKSFLEAHLSAGSKHVGWGIEINCTDKYVSEFSQPPQLIGPPLDWQRQWRKLAGEKFEFTFDEKRLHPIMPGNPGNFYDGQHRAPNHHRLQFKKRIGNTFLIDWHCEAKMYEEDDAVPIYVYARIPFKRVTVQSDHPMTIEQAKLELDQHFDLADFEPNPEKQEWSSKTFIEFKMKTLETKPKSP